MGPRGSSRAASWVLVSRANNIEHHLHAPIKLKPSKSGVHMRVVPFGVAQACRPQYGERARGSRPPWLTTYSLPVPIAAALWGLVVVQAFWQSTFWRVASHSSCCDCVGCSVVCWRFCVFPPIGVGALWQPVLRFLVGVFPMFRTLSRA